VKETYNYDVISLFLQAVPAGVLDRERVAYMARDDLEKQALVAAEEKVRREMAEKSAQILEGEKAIIEEKVREQTAEITEEKEALKRAVEEINANYLQIQRTEAKLLASVKGLSLGFILTDTENNVITSNEAVKRILKITEDIKSIQDIATKMQDKVDLMAAIGQSKNDTMPVELKELEVLDAILHVTITPVFLTEPHKEYIGTVILIDDITEEKQLERTKDEFFAIASHELRTPLTAIRGSVSILKNYYADKITEGDIPTLITYIDQSSVHLIDIVNEFLNVSRLEQGRITFKNERFSLSDLVSQTVNEFRTLAEKKQLFLRYDNEGTQHSPVFADQDKTKQIFINLIGNAIKFTEHGGISVLTEEKDESVFVKITDTGLGIPTVNQKLLFRKFQQADPNILTHDASKGTGLGLYISKKLIENMSGSIFLERSEDGRGSTFTFSLPIAKDTA
jgi:signal transduction histidine kinase